MIQESIKLALEYFSGDYNCAQSVMKAILKGMNLDFDQVTFLAAGLGAGMAHEGNVCGAVSGAIAALGVITAIEIKDVKQHKEATYEVTENFVTKFKEKHGTILCDRLTGIQMRDLDQRKLALKQGTFQEKCPNFVSDAVQMALELAMK